MHACSVRPQHPWMRSRVRASERSEASVSAGTTSCFFVPRDAPADLVLDPSHQPVLAGGAGTRAATGVSPEREHWTQPAAGEWMETRWPYGVHAAVLHWDLQGPVPLRRFADLRSHGGAVSLGPAGQGRDVASGSESRPLPAPPGKPRRWGPGAGRAAGIGAAGSCGSTQRSRSRASPYQAPNDKRLVSAGDCVFRPAPDRRPVSLEQARRAIGSTRRHVSSGQLAGGEPEAPQRACSLLLLRSSSSPSVTRSWPTYGPFVTHLWPIHGCFAAT